MFASTPDANRALTTIPSLNPPLPAVRGFGYQPDGAVGSIEHHLSGQGLHQDQQLRWAERHRIQEESRTFSFSPPAPSASTRPGFPIRWALASFLLAYDSIFRPIVGQQVTLAADSGADSDLRLALLTARAELATAT